MTKYMTMMHIASAWKDKNKKKKRDDEEEEGQAERKRAGLAGCDEEGAT